MKNEYSEIPEEQLLGIETQFHSLLIDITTKLNRLDDVQLPNLNEFIDSGHNRAFVGVPGMMGGGHYWFDFQDDEPRLIAEFTSRMSIDDDCVRYEITPTAFTCMVNKCD